MHIIRTTFNIAVIILVTIVAITFFGGIAAAALIYFRPFLAQELGEVWSWAYTIPLVANSCFSTVCVLIIALQYFRRPV